MVQFEMKRRKEGGKCHSGANCFSSKIICGDCGNFYGSKVWHSTSKYRRTIWRCNHKFKGSDKCKTPHIDEANLKQLFLSAFNQLITNKEEIGENCKMLKKVLTDTAALEAEAVELQREIEVVTGLIRQCVEENAQRGQDQVEYLQRYKELVARYEKVRGRLEKNEELSCARKVKREQLDAFLDMVLRQDSILTEFDEGLWYAVIEKVTVDASGGIKYTFRDGTVITA
ncbi:zinc ribbon domain-containing protein [Desulfitobacterium dichloroeliminans]|uniref:zinc ribbon domain-containing protein n=1 Tax=Desulfitobacterium dichloroeliminans TaxID=233055 RepID=UPI0031F33ABA